MRLGGRWSAVGGGPTAAGPCGRGRARPPAGPGGVRRGRTHSRTLAPRTGPCPSPPRASVPSLVTPMWRWPGGGPCAPAQLSAPRHRLTRCVAHRQGPRAENHEPHEGPKACHWEHVASRPGAGLFVPQKTQKSCASHPGEEAAVTGGRGTGTGGTHLCGLQRELRACRSPTARHGACTPFLSPFTRGRANAASTLTRRASQSDGDPLGPGWEVPLHPAQGSRALGPPSD